MFLRRIEPQKLNLYKGEWAGKMNGLQEMKGDDPYGYLLRLSCL